MRKTFVIGASIAWLGAMAISPSAHAASHSQRDPSSVKVIAGRGGEFTFAPSDLVVEAGWVAFTVENWGRYPHGFKVEGLEGGVARIEPGTTATLPLKLKEGQYTFYCPLRGHRERGMEGKLKVVGKEGSTP